ncbi:hypothetical protein EIL26_20130 [Salmonella enterica subsp. enterica serovar Newport]|uniref:Uncharacterized protein n=2 Tax=Salmonella enterica TaxID=28901 RepID=A0A3Z6QRT7_SALEB|nr:hypothetical protein CHC34_28045 [Salmonella enterica]EAB6033036.1 hypothetical protein [Salmonella enterica subsp. enterica serovar Java]EBV8392150.1 hypothetical protein [Salmonella enterica subsp. enterica serovar Virchow]ECA0404150.1 hypothetical protein [Salmonella enterica subsp. enterica serovar Newport]ECC9065753.1 hypothetical protein [Salmonella enterica subsp. diarizonae]
MPFLLGGSGVVLNLLPCCKRELQSLLTNDFIWVLRVQQLAKLISLTNIRWLLAYKGFQHFSVFIGLIDDISTRSFLFDKKTLVLKSLFIL